MMCNDLFGGSNSVCLSITDHPSTTVIHDPLHYRFFLSKTLLILVHANLVISNLPTWYFSLFGAFFCAGCSQRLQTLILLPVWWRGPSNWLAEPLPLCSTRTYALSVVCPTPGCTTAFNKCLSHVLSRVVPLWPCAGQGSRGGTVCYLPANRPCANTKSGSAGHVVSVTV